MCKLIFRLLFLLIIVNKSEHRLNLQFSDEFNENDFIDESKWNVSTNTDKCNTLDYLNCNTNNKINLRIINGTLVLAAIREKYLDKNYTSVSMTTKKSFTFKRFEMRAALPKGKMLGTNIALKSDNKLGYPWVNIFTHNQTNELNIGIFFENSSHIIHSFKVEKNLNDFNDYTFEWNETQMQWIFNQRVLYTFNITEELKVYYNPFDKPFKLAINLGVGGNAFPDQTLNELDAYNWKCSLLMIDFIRVYQNSSEEQSVNITGIESNEMNKHANYVRSVDVCNEVMPLIRGKPPSWNLVYAQEFNEDLFDGKEWDVINHINQCNFADFLNCNTNNKTNLRTINGNLVLAAIREKYLNKYFTSSFMTTKESFTFGRFEMRAALPKGKMLRPGIYLLAVNPTGLKYGEYGEIAVMSYHQNNELRFETSFWRNGKHDFIRKSVKVEENLNDFNDYTFEWNETQMQWIFNQRVLYTFNITEELKGYYNPFDKPFKINIQLTVGSEYFFPGQILYEKDVNEWNCSLFIIDHLRVYQHQFSETNLIVPDQSSDVSSSSICGTIMPTIAPRPKTWKLIFNDEFYENLDDSVWVIREGLLCNGYNLTNCQNNGTGIIGLTDGIVFLTLNPNNNIDSKSVQFVSKKSITFGRFVIRASLPHHGHSLRSSIYMLTQSNDKGISIVSYTASGQIFTGITFLDGLVLKSVGQFSNESVITESLFDFHIYSMEWTETEIRFFIDDKHVFTASLMKEFVQTINKFAESFHLAIILALDKNSPIPLQSEQSETSFCSMLIIDYLKVYQLSDHNFTSFDIPDQNLINSSSICEKIRPFIKNEEKLSPFSISMTPVIIISSLLIISIIIGINIFLYIRMKNKINSKSTDHNVSKMNDYDDIDETEMDAIYSNPYENDNVYCSPTYDQSEMHYLEIYPDKEPHTNCDYTSMNVQ